jgi:endoribonuclease LACTB2
MGMASQLVPLAEVERLSPTCIRILGGNPSKFTLQGTNTYLVGKGTKRILIDTAQGMQSWKDALAKVLAEEGAKVESALITHWHGDHVGGIQDLLGLCPEAKIYKHSPSDDQLDISDGQVFSVDGATLKAVHTPGHTTDHMVFVQEEEDALFTGDNVLGQGTAVFEDLATYLDSLDRMRRLVKGRAYPGHGPVLADGPAKISEYISHRRQREEQVLRTLRSSEQAADPGAWTAMEIVKVIYRDVPEDLHMAAAGGILQILRKLEREGKVVLDNERWRLKDRSTL